MKKLFLSALCFLAMGTSAWAIKLVPLSVTWERDKEVGNQGPKSPICPPQLFIDDYTLQFSVGHPDYVLNIKDEYGDVVYTTTVFESMTQVTLPSSLSGDYEVELIMGNWKFTGYINI